MVPRELSSKVEGLSSGHANHHPVGQYATINCGKKKVGDINFLSFISEIYTTVEKRSPFLVLQIIKGVSRSSVVWQLMTRAITDVLSVVFRMFGTIQVDGMSHYSPLRHHLGDRELKHRDEDMERKTRVQARSTLHVVYENFYSLLRKDALCQLSPLAFQKENLRTGDSRFVRSLQIRKYISEVSSWFVGKELITKRSLNEIDARYFPVNV